MALTDRTIRFLKPGQAITLRDGSGLYLRVSVKGTKTWFFRSQVAGKDRLKKLGRYPTMSLLEARNQASRAAQQGVLTFSVAQAYTEYLPHLRRSYASWPEINRRFEKAVLPEIGTKPVDQVTKRDGSDLLQKIVARGARVAANRTMADLKHFFDYCVDRGWIQGSPVASIKRKSVGGRERSRERALSWKELEHVLQLTRWNLDTRLALGLILFTGQRPGEVLGYDEREREGVWWHIPGARTKNKRPQEVYLSPQARHLLKLAVQHFGKKPFRLDHRTLDRGVKRLFRKVFPDWTPFTPHDLRRTMATRLADLGVAPHVVEKMLNHQMEGAMAVYNRGEYLSERRAAWRLWGAKLAQLRRKHHAKAAHPAPAHRLQLDTGIRTNNS